MFVTVPTLRQLARQVGGSVKCDLGSTVAGATRLIVGASGATPDGGVRFLGEFFIMADTFTLGQVWQNLLNYRAHMHLSLSNDL